MLGCGDVMGIELMVNHGQPASLQSLTHYAGTRFAKSDAESSCGG